jgi:hypothetical protein
VRITQAQSYAAWERWQAAAGPWWKGWSICPALLPLPLGEGRGEGSRAADTRDFAPALDLAREIASELLGSLGSSGVLVVLDLEPVLGIHIAARLNEQRAANAVLVLPRWPYRQAILPVDPLVHALVECAPRLSQDECLPNVAFVLDADRGRPIHRRPRADPRADNRYSLSTADLPNLTSLRARGIQKIVVVKRTPATSGRG